MKPPRISLLLLLTCLASFPTTTSFAADPATSAPPNVLLILVDDLGYGDLGCYGAKDLATPRIDRLIGRGMRLSRFYANCPVCSPTRASVLTGCFPDVVGVPGVIRTHSSNSWGYLAPDAKTLASVLRGAGYRTAMVGKWHLGLGEPNLPNQRGFEHFHGFLGDMMDDYYHHRRHNVNYMRLNDETIDPEGHATDLFSQWTCRWLEDYQDDAPFFLYLAYNAPHSPIQPPKDFFEAYQKRHPDVPPLRARYAALVEHLDTGIGQVIDCLDRTGLADDTLVLFASDNGGAKYFGANNGPLAGGKQEMLEGGIRVAMGARWPGKIPAGGTTDRVAATMDLFPTVCEAAGVEIDGAIDGRSFLPTLLGRPQDDVPRDLFWVRLEGGRRYQGKPYHAVRRDQWKLLHNSAEEPLRLFDLTNDPGETTDLSGSHPEIVARLRDALDGHVKRCEKTPWRDESGAVGREAREESRIPPLPPDS